MPVGSEATRLVRTIEELVDGVQADIKGKQLSAADRLALKTEIEASIQKLDQLRAELAADPASAPASQR